jgi:hypothetical protein
MFAIRASIRHCLISPSVESELIAELKQEPGALGNMAQLVPMTMRAYAVKQYNDNPMWRNELWELYGLPAARRYFRMYYKQIAPSKREKTPLWTVSITDKNREYWQNGKTPKLLANELGNCPDMFRAIVFGIE